MIKKVLTLLILLLLPLVLLLTGVEIATRDDAFFRQQYQENQVTDATGMDLDGLMEVTEGFQDYLFGKRDDLHLEAEIHGQRQTVFKEREIVHMEDVRILFDRGILFRNLALLFLMVTGIWAVLKKESFFWRGLLYGVALMLAVGVLLGILLTLDFNRYFVLFHEIFFANDYWMLDPADSVLINMVPLNFFMSIARRILLWTGLGMVLTTGLALFLRNKRRLP